MLVYEPKFHFWVGLPYDATVSNLYSDSTSNWALTHEGISHTDYQEMKAVFTEYDNSKMELECQFPLALNAV